MKKLISTLLATLILISCFAGTTAFAAEENSVYDYEVLDDGTVEITKYKIKDTLDCVIPSEIDGKAVTTICGGAFNETRVTKICIPSTVTTIAGEAFTENKALKAYEVDAANPCYKSVDGVLYSKDGKTLVAYPIGDGKTSYTVPADVKTIQGGAFDHSNMKSVKLNEGLEKIDSRVFWYCKDLSDITLPSTLREIGRSCFVSCNNLKSINIPEGIKRIEYMTFESTGLESVDLPDSLEYLDDNAFGWCNYLTTVKIGPNLSEIVENPFLSSYALAEIKVDKANKYYTDVDGVLFTKDMTRLCVFAYDNGITEYKIPSKVKIIGSQSFWYNKNLTSIEFPKGLETIESAAFCGVKNLQSINIPEGLEKLEFMTFDGCEKLETVYLPESLKKIASDCFDDCDSIKDVYYAGSSSEWSKINIDKSGNEGLLNANIHFGKEDCKNHTIKVTGAKKATYFADGKTGSKVCTTCGEIIKASAKISKKVLKTPAITVKSGKKSIKVTAKKVTDAKGFIISYQLKGGKAKTLKVKTTKALSKTISKLKTGKTYTVKVRAFVTSGSKTAYSKWSSSKSVKVK